MSNTDHWIIDTGDGCELAGPYTSRGGAITALGDTLNANPDTSEAHIVGPDGEPTGDRVTRGN